MVMMIRLQGCLLPEVSWGDVAQSSVDGDGSGVETSHHVTHLLSVTEAVGPPHLSSAFLEDHKGGSNVITQQLSASFTDTLSFFCLFYQFYLKRQKVKE